MGDVGVELSLLLAQAQRVGKSNEIALAVMLRHGKKSPLTRQKWKVFYDEVATQNQQRKEFLEKYFGLVTP